jgi:hypothetical protein
LKKYYRIREKEGMYVVQSKGLYWDYIDYTIHYYGSVDEAKRRVELEKSKDKWATIWCDHPKEKLIPHYW